MSAIFWLFFFIFCLSHAVPLQNNIVPSWNNMLSTMKKNSLKVRLKCNSLTSCTSNQMQGDNGCNNSTENTSSSEIRMKMCVVIHIYCLLMDIPNELNTQLMWEKKLWWLVGLHCSPLSWLTWRADTDYWSERLTSSQQHFRHWNDIINKLVKCILYWWVTCTRLV